MNDNPTPVFPPGHVHSSGSVTSSGCSSSQTTVFTCTDFLSTPTCTQSSHHRNISACTTVVSFTDFISYRERSFPWQVLISSIPIPPSTTFHDYIPFRSRGSTETTTTPSKNPLSEPLRLFSPAWWFSPSDENHRRGWVTGA